MLGNHIKKQRELSGYSQPELAKILNVSKQSVSNWENDNVQPSIDMVEKMADLFHCSIDYLIDRPEYDETIIINLEGWDTESKRLLHQVINFLNLSNPKE